MENTMYKLLEIGDVFVDAAVKDSMGQMLFVSFIGTDTELQALAGRLSLSSSHPEHIKTVNFRDENNDLVMLSFPKSLEKASQRMDLDAVMNGVHVFWYQKKLLPQYFDAGKGILVNKLNISEDEFNEQLWQMIKHVCRPPLLDHWRETLLPIFLEHEWVTPLSSWGCIQSYNLDFPEEHIEVIEKLVKEKRLLPTAREVVTCH
jgi:hypothetical protein